MHKGGFPFLFQQICFGRPFIDPNMPVEPRTVFECCWKVCCYDRHFYEHIEKCLLHIHSHIQFLYMHKPLDKRLEISFLISKPKHIVVGTQKNCLNETVLLSTHNQC